MTNSLEMRGALTVMGLLSTALASTLHLAALPPDSTLSQPPMLTPHSRKTDHRVTNVLQASS